MCIYNETNHMDPHKETKGTGTDFYTFRSVYLSFCLCTFMGMDNGFPGL